MIQITLGIDGMACEMCEAHVNDTIRGHFQVKKVSSSHKKGETVILTENEISEAALRAAIDPTGYVVKSFKSEPYVRKGFFSFGKNKD